MFPLGLKPTGTKTYLGLRGTINDRFREFRNFLRTSNDRLPLKHGSNRPQTWPKRVSDDSRHFIFRPRRNKIGKHVRWTISSNHMFRQKVDKLPVFEELWIFGRNRQMRLEKWPPKFWLSALYDFWQRGKKWLHDFWLLASRRMCRG